MQLAKKLGFVLEGVNKEAKLKDGKFLDVYNFGLLYPMWQKQDIYKR